MTAIAPWFHMRLPSCGRGFESQSHHLRFYQFVLLEWEKRIKINEKEAWISPFKNTIPAFIMVPIHKFTLNTNQSDWTWPLRQQDLESFVAALGTSSQRHRRSSRGQGRTQVPLRSCWSRTSEVRMRSFDLTDWKKDFGHFEQRKNTHLLQKGMSVTRCQMSIKVAQKWFQ